MNLKDLRDDTRGAALVEFAVTLPIFFLLMFGGLQAALMLWAQIGLQHGVETAAYCASVSDAAIAAGLNPATNPTPCYSVAGNAAANAATVKSYAASNSSGFNPPASAFSVSVNSTSPACANGNLVTASYPFTAIHYVFSMTLTAKSCYPTS